MKWKNIFLSAVKGKKIYDATLISDTNNLVYHISCDKGEFIAKIIRDFPIEGKQLKICSQALKEKIHIQNVIGTYLIPNTKTEIVVADYYPGINVATLIEEGGFDLEQEEKFAHFLVELVSNLPNCLPINSSRFGKCKKNSQSFTSIGDFLRNDIDKYCSRLSHLQHNELMWSSLKEKLYKNINNCEINKHFTPGFCSFDMNMKNFLRINNGEFLVLNLPVTGYLDPMMTVAAVSANTIGSPSVRELFLKSFITTAESNIKLLLFETLVLLGHLSAAAGDKKERVDHAKAWGWGLNFKEQISIRYKALT